MIISTLFAASLLFTPPQYVPSAAVVDKAMAITATVMICEPVLPTDIVQEWLRLAQPLGVSQTYIATLRVIVREKGLRFTETDCRQAIYAQGQELIALMSADVAR